MIRHRSEAGRPRLFSFSAEAFRSPFLPKGAPSFDGVLAAAVLLLALCGTAAVFSAGYAYAEVRYGDRFFFIKRQALWLLLGILLCFSASRIKPETYFALAPLLYFITLLLLLLVLLIGMVGNGAKRWISIGPITIQPSEMAKMTLVTILARYFSLYRKPALFPKSERENFLYGTLFPCLLLACPVVLVLLQKHLSCIIILGILGLLVILTAGVSPRYIAGASGIAAVGVACLALFTDYTKARITVWLDPAAYALEGGWQTLQGLMAIGSGGLFGRGIGQSLLKYCYVSEPANDMIFAILCEETGLFGALGVLALFAVLVIRGFSLALSCSGTFERLTAFGVTAKIAIQTLLNVAVVTNTIPNTGISLPFFSYGGSSLLMLFFEMGMLLSFSRFAKMKA